MRTGPATPEEEAELLRLLYVLGQDHWPEENTKARALNYLRLEEDRRHREYRSGYECGRLARNRAGAAADGR